jgi:hypothetical protein
MKKNEHGGAGLIVLVVLAAMVAVMAFTVAGAYGYVNGLRSEGVEREAQLTTQYLSNQNYLSAYVSGFYEQVGVANLKSEKMDQILLDAVKGRYEDNGGFAPNGAFFSGIMEAYPDLKGLDVYDKIMNYVSAGREGYRAIQEKLLDMVRAYDVYRNDGYVQSWVIKNIVGVPSERLEARVGDKVARGMDARDRMLMIVLTSDTKKAYETGVMEPLQPVPPPKK